MLYPQFLRLKRPSPKTRLTTLLPVLFALPMTPALAVSLSDFFSANDGYAQKLAGLKVPAGYTVSLAASVPNARQMALADNGMLVVGSRHQGEVSVLEDKDSDGYFETRHLIASGLNMPSGIAVKGEDVFVGAVNRILRFKGVLANPSNPTLPLEVTSHLPSESHHGWKYLRFGPNGQLYFNVGAPCNVCLEDDPRFASIMRIDTETGETNIVAHGVRNSVGFDFHPTDKHLWFTDNGRDMLGDDIPPDELNHASSEGLHFGFPYQHARNIKDPKFGSALNQPAFQGPAHEFQAHVAPLGMAFYTGQQFTQADENTLFVAEHGSWNRSKKVGYLVSKLVVKDGNVQSYEPFVTGWLVGEKHWGRPADILVDTDGSLLIADDYAGYIVRVSYAATPSH